MRVSLAWLILIVLAVVLRVLPSPGFEITFPGKGGHHAVSPNLVAFWMLLLVVAIWIVVELTKRIMLSKHSLLMGL